MDSKKIYITHVQDIVEFINKASKVEPGVNVYKGQMVFDGGSLIGMMAIDLATGVVVEYPSDATEFAEYIEQFTKDN